MNRTTIVLAVVALLLGGYIFFVDRGTLSTGELERRKGSALPELIRDKVERLEIQRKGVTTVLVRDVGKDLPDENTLSEDEDAMLWRVEAPYEAKADQDAVDTVLGALEWLDGRRKLGPVDAKDRAQFGLDKPRVRIAFTVGKVRVKLAVGNESPRGDGVYVLAGDPPQAFVAGKDLLEAVNREPGAYHHKELHDGMMVATTRAIELRDAQGTRAAQKRDDGTWVMTKGADGLASQQVVSELVQDLDSLRTQRFVAGGVKDFAHYGLTAPRFALDLTKTKLLTDKVKPGEKPPREEVSFSLRVGGPCEGHPGESYVHVQGSADVSCASDADLEKLNESSEALREARLLPLAEDAVKSVQLRRRGLQLALTSTDGAWSYALTGLGAGKLEGKAREGSVSDWLKALSAATVTRYDVPPPAELAGPAAFALDIGQGDKKPAFGLRAVVSGMDLIVRRADEPRAVAVAASAADLLAPQAARFRVLQVLNLSEPNLRQMEIDRAGVHERLTRAQGGQTWTLSQPQSLAADRLIAGELARSLSALEAVRFDADEPAPQHGLASPSAVVTLEHAASDSSAPQRTVIELGAATEGGRFAQVRGRPGVFVMTARSADLLLEPLVSRSLLAAPLERLRKVELRHGGSKLRIERGSEGFTAAGGPAATPDAARALSEAVATLRALHVVAYGPPAANTGLQRPDTQLEVQVDAAGEQPEQRYTITIGADAGEGARYARRSDVAVTFTLAKETVERLLAPLSAAAPQ